MDKNNEAFLKRLLATFQGEAAEHVQAISAGLIELDKATEPAQRQGIVETVFRETHSLKGAARAVGRSEIETLCQAMEHFFSLLKGGDIELSPARFELLYDAEDLLGKLLAGIGGEPTKAHLATLWELTQRFTVTTGVSDGKTTTTGPTAKAQTGTTDMPVPEPVRTGGEQAPVPTPLPGSNADAPPTPEPGPAEALPTRIGDTVRVPVTRLDAILFQSESLLSAKLTAHQRAEDIRGAQGALVTLAQQRARIAPEIRALQRRQERAERKEGHGRTDPQLRRLLEYLLLEDDFIKGYELRLETLAKAAEHDWRTLGSMAEGLLDDVKMALMLPVASAIEVLPKFVRDGARSQGKEVDFNVNGGETEIDRRILEDLRDPLIHLIRNSLDHGIETPAARLAAGKPRRGRVDLDISQMEGGRIEILVADDGAGIALDKVREAARKLGLSHGDGEETQGEKSLLDLIFQSGLSTSPIITDLSGRGLGLAIVQEKVERLGGSVTVTSEPGTGTRFRLTLPLTLSTFRGVHIRCGEREFIFPTMHLAQVARVAQQDIATVENRETIPLSGQTVSLMRLAQVLDIAEDPAVAVAENVPVVVAGTGENRIAFLVDEVLGEQEVLVKSMGRQLRRVRNIVGATVLGNGRVVPILHVPDLLKSARRSAAPGRRFTTAVVEKRKSLLVAEDSITSRMLLKGILEAAGYQVRTAVDGLDAYTQLRTEPVDLLVSDVDMPRMSGFDLTARVRADKTLAALPVVLVTALESREDKERGAEAGANAYIVKSSFDQSNLLAVIRRLL